MNAFKAGKLELMLESGKTSNLSNLNDAKEAVNQETRSIRPELTCMLVFFFYLISESFNSQSHWHGYY